MKHFVGLLAAGTVAAVALGTSNAAADILAAATNAVAFDSTSTVEVAIPIANGGSTQLKFTTVAAKTRVKITYNTSCVMTGPRGRILLIRVLVDGVDAKPFDGGDFTLCSTIDAAGKTFAAVTRQVLFNVPSAGDHFVKIVGLASPASAYWLLDNSSLFVEK